jgi:hypothetical protein
MVLAILKWDYPRTIPARFGLIWFSSFRGKDLNVIFYQNMPNRYKSAERKISQKNPEYMLNYSLQLNFELILTYTKAAMALQNCVQQPHPPSKISAVTKNRNVFNCPLLLYCKAK